MIRNSQPPWVRETTPPAALTEVGPRTDRGLFLGYGPLIREYVYFTLAKLTFHRHHPEFNGEWGTSLKMISAKTDRRVIRI